MAEKTQNEQTQKELLRPPENAGAPKTIKSDHPFFGLQRTAGNQAVQRLLDHERQKSASAGSPAHEKQPKPEISPIAAGNANTSSSAPIRRTCACHGSGVVGKCATCAAEDELQRSSKADAGKSEVAPGIVHQVLRSSGQPLDESTRSLMASRFGNDFRQVRVSSDDNSAQAADAIQARAFTWGNRIVFGRNEYNARSSSGLRLIAHELAHTIQQSQRPKSLQPNLSIGSVDDPQEREADLAADAALRAQPVPAMQAGQSAVRRQPKGRDPWQWKGDNEGIYTTDSGVKYTITRSFKPVTTSEKTKVTPGAKFAKAYLTITWCKNGVRGTAEAGIDITNQLQQIIPQLLGSQNSQQAEQVLRQAKLTPYIDLVVIPSEKGPIRVDLHGDVSSQGVTGVGGGVSVQTPIGEIGGSVDVDLPPGGRPTPSVNVRITPGDTSPKKKVECETTTFEAVYTCHKEVQVPPSDYPITVSVPSPSRVRSIYFDYAKDIVTSAATPYGKQHPEIVTRNKAALEDLRQDFTDEYQVSSITGYTSPEGPMSREKAQGGFEGNTELSGKRAQAALDYVAGICALRKRGCFVKDKDVKPVAGGELHTLVENGKEAEGKKLADFAVPDFMDTPKEASTLSEKEREDLAKKRGTLAQAEIIYPLLRRAEIMLERGMVPKTIIMHDPGGPKDTDVDCPDYILTDAKAHFALNDALKGKSGP